MMDGCFIIEKSLMEEVWLPADFKGRKDGSRPLSFSEVLSHR